MLVCQVWRKAKSNCNRNFYEEEKKMSWMDSQIKIPEILPIVPYDAYLKTVQENNILKNEPKQLTTKLQQLRHDCLLSVQSSLGSQPPQYAHSPQATQSVKLIDAMRALSARN